MSTATREEVVEKIREAILEEMAEDSEIQEAMDKADPEVAKLVRSVMDDFRTAIRSVR